MVMASLRIRGDGHYVAHFHNGAVAGVAHQVCQGVPQKVVNAHHFRTCGTPQHVGSEVSALRTEAALTLSYSDQAGRGQAKEELKKCPICLGAAFECVVNDVRCEPVRCPRCCERCKTCQTPWIGNDIWHPPQCLATLILNCSNESGLCPFVCAWANAEKGVKRGNREGKEQIADSRMLLDCTWNGKEPASTSAAGPARQGRRKGRREVTWCQQPRKAACAVCSSDRQPRQPMRVQGG
eukprot:SM000078S22041  [mRNA]  locus=s78:158917:159630:+ [translate_table: standard]